MGRIISTKHAMIRIAVDLPPGADEVQFVGFLNNAVSVNLALSGFVRWTMCKIEDGPVPNPPIPLAAP